MDINNPSEQPAASIFLKLPAKRLYQQTTRRRIPKDGILDLFYLLILLMAGGIA
jgi:hypothetical protein